MDSSLTRELKLYQKRKAKAQDKGNLEEESKLCYIIGELFAQYGFYGDAVKEYKQALQVSEAREDTIGSAVAHRMVGECLCALGKYKDALFHQGLHLELAKSSNNLVEQQRAWATIGRTWFVYSDSAVDAAETEESLMQSQKAYLEALSVCDKLQGITSETELLEMRSRLYLNLGLVYDSKNDIESARKFIDQARHIAREQHLQETEFRCHYCIGGVLTKIGLNTQAQHAFEKAVQLARKNNKKFDEADALVQLGQVFLKMGDFLLARRTLKKAYKISPLQAGGVMDGLKSNLVAAIKGLKLINKLNELSEGKENDKMKILDALGDLYSNVKSYQKALEFYNKELDVAKFIGLSPNKLSPIYVSLAMTYSDLGQPKKAVECYMEELETIDGNYKGMCDTWCNVAQVYENSGEDYEEIERAYLTAIKYAEKANKVPMQIRVYKCLADTQKKCNNMKLYNKTIKKIENLESEFGIEEESGDEKEEEHGHDKDDDDDDDAVLQREMLLPDSDEEDENEDSNDESVIKHRTRSAARAKLSKKNEKGETPLHRAAIAGDVELVDRLIEQGADINTRDYCGWQPLHEACNHGYTEIVRALLAKGANVNDPGGSHCQGVTPLHDAAQNGHIEVVKLLVENGASLLNKDARGCTPLDAVLAAQESEEDRDLIGCETKEVAGRKDVVKYLKRISLGQTSSNVTLNNQPEMMRRNRLFLEDDDSNNQDDSDDDDDDDDDTVRGPSQSRSKSQLKGVRRKHITSPLDSDDDDDIDEDDVEDSPVPKTAESRFPKNPVTDFPHEGTRNESRKTSKSPMRETTLSKSLLQKKRPTTGIDSDLYISDSENDEDFSVRFEDESSCSPVNNHSPVRQTTTSSDQKPRRRSLGAERTSIDDSSDPSSDWPSSNFQDSSLSYVDSVSSRREDANGSREQTPALISERDLGSSVIPVSDDSDWLIDDVHERPTKRRRTNKQATLSSSMTLSRRGPSAYPSKDTRSNSFSNTSRKASRPKQARLEVRRTPSPTYFSSSISRQSRAADETCATTSFQTHSSGQPMQGESTGHQTSGASTGGAPPMRIRVQVQGKTFLIPCPEKNDQEHKTIAWLAEQAKLRYFSAFGLRPVLALQTSEGAFLSPEDKISDVLSNNEQIVASLESWDLPPVAERYKTACISNNCDIKKDIQALLLAEPQISVISLGNLALKDFHVLPLARALQCHDRLVKLILPGNKIGDSGVQHISASLSTLPNLAVLDLRSNGITHKGVTYLASALSKNTDMQEITSSTKLEELNIGYNALYDMCGSSLANILITCSQLNSLHLQSCCFTGKLVEPSKPLAEALKASSLRYLSIAYNNFEGLGLRDLLATLPCHVLHHLDVSSTVTNKSNVAMAMEGLVRYMDKEDCALQDLNLSNCCLGTRDMETLTATRCFRDVLQTLDVNCNYIENDDSQTLNSLISDSQTLTNLNLSGNRGIDTDFLQLILDTHVTSSSRIQHINLTACNIDSPITPDILKMLSQHSTESSFLAELDLSFCSLNQTDRTRVAEAWKKGAGKYDEKEAIVQDSLCILGSVRK